MKNRISPADYPEPYATHPMNSSTTSQQKGNWKWRAFGGVVIVCIAAFLLALGALQTYQSLAVRGWATATAVITKMEIEKDPSRPVIFCRYEAKVVYEYTVNGERLVGKNIRLLPVSSTYASDLEWVKDQYPVGSLHDVYFKAGDPSIACLRHDHGIGHFIMVGVCFSLIVAGLWDLTDFVRSKL